MKIGYYSLAGLLTLSLATLSSCFDNDYDLSDIDTTAKFLTKDLVVPINLDYITLDQVLDIDDDSEVVKTTDGDGNTIYAIKKEGDFSSAPIEVDAFSIGNIHITPSSSDVYLSNEFAGMVGTAPSDITVQYNLSGIEAASFNSGDTSFDEAIKEIDELGVNTTFNYKIEMRGVKRATFKNLKIQYPKGLTATASNGTYDPETGLLSIQGESATTNGQLSISLNVTGIQKTDKIKIDYNSHRLSYGDDIYIAEGELYAQINAGEQLLNHITIVSTPEISTIKVNTFTGKVEYDVDDFNIAPIRIDDLPDLLNQSGTKIMLENPQIYLSLTNPLYAYEAYFQTGFQLTSKRDGKSKTYAIDNGTFATGSPAKATDNKFVLSPTTPTYYYSGYSAADTKFVAFSSLKNILAEVDGIPTTIEVNAIDPMMPEQAVTGFQLGKKHEGVKGGYAFYAPLQLSDESQIVYTDTIDGWNDEDVDAITIEKLTVNFDGTTDVPFEMELTVLPIDTTGSPIAGVTSTTAHVNAKAQNQPIEVTVEGNITHLDGILIKANLVNQGSETTLVPEMKLYMKNSKATVTGYYEKEL